MSGILVDLGAATICFLGQCYPALVGETTPVGQYTVIERRVLAAGYGGDVLQFKQEGDEVFAIHRVYLGNPKQRRLERLQSDNPEDRKITLGCVNVMPEVYDALKACCVDQVLTIKP